MFISFLFVFILLLKSSQHKSSPLNHSHSFPSLSDKNWSPHKYPFLNRNCLRDNRCLFKRCGRHNRGGFLWGHHNRCLFWGWEVLSRNNWMSVALKPITHAIPIWFHQHYYKKSLFNSFFFSCSLRKLAKNMSKKSICSQYWRLLSKS